MLTRERVSLSELKPMLGRERFVIDCDGNRIAVLIDIHDYRRLLDALEEAESDKAFDKAKGSHEQAIPVGTAIAEIELLRVKKKIQ